MNSYIFCVLVLTSKQIEGQGLFYQYAPNNIDAEDPPPPEQVVKMARYILRHSRWTSMATISSREVTAGLPFSTVLSVSDGTATNSTGIPYLYLTTLDPAVEDLKANGNASLMMTLAQGEFCDKNGFDPEDPRCAMVSFTGKIVSIPKYSTEEQFAKSAMFYKHPLMEKWAKGNDWFAAKLEIVQILVRDYFGGVSDVNIEEYFALPSTI